MIRNMGEIVKVLDSSGFWKEVDEGVSALRLTSEEAAAYKIPVSPREFIWLTCFDGEVFAKIDEAPVHKHLNKSDSSVFVWPRSDWSLFVNLTGASEAAVFRITLGALHKMLAVDYTDGRAFTGSGDFSALTRTVHFSPLRLRQLSRMFINSFNSRFSTISRRGIFYEVFAELLEILYGGAERQCPFQIDAETERKLRHVHHLVISDLRNQPDLGELALTVDLPRTLVREGFQFLYGQNIPEYQQEYKFEQARIMLEGGRYLIKEIAYQLGYRNPSHFISAFKLRYGTTPKQWAMQNTA